MQLLSPLQRGRRASRPRPQMAYSKMLMKDLEIWYEKHLPSE
jgi:hypothetical protein